MSAFADSSSDSDSVIVPSTLHRRCHGRVLLSDSDPDTPATASMRQSMPATCQQMLSPHTTPAKHAKSPAAANRQITPSGGHQHATSHAAAATARLPAQRKVQLAAADDLVDCMTSLLLDTSAVVPAQPGTLDEDLVMLWPDASSPTSGRFKVRRGTAAASRGDTAVADAALSVTTSCRSISAGWSSGCLTFTRTAQRGRRQLALSDSDSEHASNSTGSQASPAANMQAAAAPAPAVRRLSFAAPGFAPSTPGSRQPLPLAQLQPSVRWADASPTRPDAGLLTALQGLQLKDRAAAPDGIVDLCSSPPADQRSSPDSPDVAWTATHTPRRRRAVLSDDSGSEEEAAAAVHPAAGPASPPSSTALTRCDFLPTPWRCTPPWQFPGSRPRPRAAPATTPTKRQPPRPVSQPATLVATPLIVSSLAAPDQVRGRLSRLEAGLCHELAPPQQSCLMFNES